MARWRWLGLILTIFVCGCGGDTGGARDVPTSKARVSGATDPDATTKPARAIATH